MKFTIRIKLLLGFTIILLLSVIVQGFVFYNTNKYVNTQILEFQDLQVNKGASEIQKFFTDLSGNSASLARIYLSNPKETTAAANYVIRSNTYVKKISILSPFGKELLKYDYSGQISEDMLNYEVFSEPFDDAILGNSSISKVYYIEQGLGPHVDLFTPIFNASGEVAGVIKTQINLTLLNDAIKDIKLGKNGFVYVVDNEGRLITHPSEKYVLERPNLSSRKVVQNTLNGKENEGTEYRYVNESNVNVIAQAVKIPGYNWVIVFEQPEEEAFGFLAFIRFLFISSIIGSSVFLIILAIILSENLTRPIRNLQKSAQQIAKGDLEKSLIIKSGDEIESLSYSFATLVDQLLEREHSLENTTKQLEKANVKLQELDVMKNEFVSVASHELRTPMTAIKSYLWMALQGKGGKLNEKQEYYVQRGYNSVDRLIRLVNDMLNISRIEAGRITVDMQQVDLGKLSQEVIEEVMPRANELGVTLTMKKIENMPNVLADPDKIKEVLFNLIGNSLKFTPKGGKIHVGFTMKDDFIETQITDTGNGIEAEDIGKLFQKFGLLPGSYTTNQPVMGTGLGLYICRSIIELHQGKIWAASEGRGKGATFTFQLKGFNKADLMHFNKNAGEKKESVGLIHSAI
jgi:signal transduction histidine kinase